MNPFTLNPMPTTVFGEGSISSLPEHVRAHGSRAFVVTDPGVRDAGVTAQATDALTGDETSAAIRSRTVRQSVYSATSCSLQSRRLSIGRLSRK